MSTKDMFGLEREKRIIDSGVRYVFTPHQPIQSRDLFFGRQTEVQKIIEQINTPGQHSLLYGDRGVGKSSLANVTTELLISVLVRGKLYSKRCDSGDTFTTVVSAPLSAAGFDPTAETTTKSMTQGGKAGLKLPIAEAGVDSHRDTTTVFRNLAISPSMAVEMLATQKGLLYVDEADRLASAEDKRKLSEFIKLLSDSGSSFKVLVVGIADTADELTGAHPSVQRCLKETRLRRMDDDELRLIVAQGAARTKLSFEEDVISAIVRLSAGYPHFTHLLALKCAEEAVAARRPTITIRDLATARRLAVQDAEGTLQRQYDEAVRSHSTDMYKNILHAAALLGRDEFTAADLRAKIEETTGAPITQPSLNNYFKRLVSDTTETVLHRKGKGVYRFSDPRMPSYVKIAASETPGTQP